MGHVASHRVRAELDPRLSARVVERRALLYQAGPSFAEDRPAHVRAASSIVRFLGELFVVQDDALFVARMENEAAPVGSLSLPRGKHGLRLFGEDRGNKADKLDLEAAAVLAAEDGAEVLFIFGSGSTAARESVVVVRNVEGELTPRVVPIPAFYERLRLETEFSGTQLNVEGAVCVGSDLVFFQRGNGAPEGPDRAVDATGRIDARALLSHIDHGTPCPRLRDVTQYDLGQVGGARLTFTDGALHHGRLLYVAAAEASPDVIRDGPVSGVAIGRLDESGATYTLLSDEHGAPSADKIEGLTTARDGALLGVIDSDDTGVPAQIVRIELVGDGALD